VYLEKYSKDDLNIDPTQALKEIAEKALSVSDIHNLTGRAAPTVIT
jgi:hypothetical protein